MGESKDKNRNVDDLYAGLDAIRVALEDAIDAAQEVALISNAFGGEISRVVTSQVNSYLIPTLQKYLEDPNTPGALKPIVAFMDSVPLSMTRTDSKKIEPPKQQQAAPMSVPQPGMTDINK